MSPASASQPRGPAVVGKTTRGTLSKSQRIDLGLAVIAAVRRPGESLTLRDMAEICGCSKSAIWLIERAALNKLRRAIEP